ncbi:MAG: fructosamine kinase family protein [Planctomycetales bacterium]|nr:fructosamine kinase family protein [Planctomycetales bacterium]
MNEELNQLLTRFCNRPVRVTGEQICQGGCIHNTRIVHVDNGQPLVIKSSPAAQEILACEADGLDALSASNVIRTPQVLGLGEVQGQACLVLEFIEPGKATHTFWTRFGEQLAELHRVCSLPDDNLITKVQATYFGWHQDNFIGSTPQLNTWHDSWPEFFIECRLQPQLHWLQQKKIVDSSFIKQSQRLFSRLDALIATDEPPSLLHGDLWSGNFLVDTSGQAVLIDPAVYFGNREAELALPFLFGGFPTSFFEAYTAYWPLNDAWKSRIALYQLYHLMNHANLFGPSYLAQCVDILARY